MDEVEEQGFMSTESVSGVLYIGLHITEFSMGLVSFCTLGRWKMPMHNLEFLGIFPERFCG